jgi:hypothetical protein
LLLRSLDAAGILSKSQRPEGTVSDKAYKLIELVGTSSDSIADAVRQAVEKASKTLHNLDWFEVQEIRGRIDSGKVSQFQVKVKVGFRLD